MLVGPYYISSIFLMLSGKSSTWSYLVILMALSTYMAYSYVVISSKKLWAEQILKD